MLSTVGFTSVVRLRGIAASEEAPDQAQEHHDGEGDPIGDLGRCVVGVDCDVVEERLERPGHEGSQAKPNAHSKREHEDASHAERENLENLVHDTNPCERLRKVALVSPPGLEPEPQI